MAQAQPELRFLYDMSVDGPEAVLAVDGCTGDGGDCFVVFDEEGIPEAGCFGQGLEGDASGGEMVGGAVADVDDHA